jgi:two-component system cell cycle sensor histidine kinase/response regulator CckA
MERAQTEKILLVEDDRSVARLLGLVLQRSGFEVLQAECASEAIRLASRHNATIDLLLSDVLLNLGTALPLMEDLHKVFPKLPVLFMSGFSRDTLIDRGVFSQDLFQNGKIFFIQKPVSPADLTHAVREILGPATAGRTRSGGGVQ